MAVGCVCIVCVCVVTLQDQAGKKQDSVVVEFTTFMACFCTGHCPCKCDMSCQVVIETPVFNSSASSQSCDVAVYCTLRDILDAISEFTSTVWGGGVFAIGCLLLLGLLKMCVERSYCQHTDVDSIVLDVISGKKRRKRNDPWKDDKRNDK